MYTVYALLSGLKPIIYVGLTSDLQKRFHQHNSGLTNWSKRYRPWKIIFQENCPDRITARTREKYFKSGCGKEYLKNLAGIV